MIITYHAVLRYQQRINPSETNLGNIKRAIKEDVENGEVATRAVLRKCKKFKRGKLRETPNTLYVFNPIRRAVFICDEPKDGGLIVVTIIKLGEKK